MTVKELKDILEKCDPAIQVCVVAPDDGYDVIRGIEKVQSEKPISMHDEPEYPMVVEILAR